MSIGFMSSTGYLGSRDRCPPHPKPSEKMINMGGDECVDYSVVGILPQCMHIANHHIVHFKYIKIFCHLYLIKAENKEKKSVSALPPS